MTSATADAVAGLLRDGDLPGAVAAAVAAVKARPTLAPDRILLAELLVLEGANERADTHLKLAADQAPAELMAISQMRWLLRAAEARRAWYERGAVPDFVGEPTPRQGEAMRLALLARDGGADEVRAALGALEAGPLPEAAVDGAPPAPFRDACDLGQHGLEALTLDGRYLWLAPEHVATLALLDAQRPRDLAWRRAEAVLRDGRAATFFLPVQYFDPAATSAQRLGRETDWVEEPGGLVRGRGQRTWLVGEDAREMLSVGRLAFGDVA